MMQLRTPTTLNKTRYLNKTHQFDHRATVVMCMYIIKRTSTSLSQGGMEVEELLKRLTRRDMMVKVTYSVITTLYLEYKQIQ